MIYLLPGQVEHRMKNGMSIKQKHALTQCRLEVLSLCEYVGEGRLMLEKEVVSRDTSIQNEL